MLQDTRYTNKNIIFFILEMNTWTLKLKTQEDLQFVRNKMCKCKYKKRCTV